MAKNESWEEGWRVDVLRSEEGSHAYKRIQRTIKSSRPDAEGAYACLCATYRDVPNTLVLLTRRESGGARYHSVKEQHGLVNYEMVDRDGYSCLVRVQ